MPIVHYGVAMFRETKINNVNYAPATLANRFIKSNHQVPGFRVVQMSTAYDYMSDYPAVTLLYEWHEKED